MLRLVSVLLCLGLTGLAACDDEAPQASETPIALIPVPSSIETDGRRFVLEDSLRIYVGPDTGELRAVASTLAELLARVGVHTGSCDDCNH